MEERDGLLEIYSSISGMVGLLVNRDDFFEDFISFPWHKSTFTRSFRCFLFFGSSSSTASCFRFYKTMKIHFPPPLSLSTYNGFFSCKFRRYRCRFSDDIQQKIILLHICKTRKSIFLRVSSSPWRRKIRRDQVLRKIKLQNNRLLD